MTADPPRSDAQPVAVKPPAPWLAPLVDYGPLAVFFFAYLAVDIVKATGAMLIATIIVLGLSIAMNRRVPATTLITSAMLLIFGGLTLLFDDPQYLKVQSTVISSLFAVLLFAARAFNWPLVKMMFTIAWPMEEAGWRALTTRFALFFVGMAGINEIIARTQSTDTWVDYNVFGQTGLTIVFLIAQWPLLNRHALPAEEKDVAPEESDLSG
ncbi:MAG: septation protein IspZ [Alphaproteobacteria bacterium]|nr:septation protein IspZ [Alphaproteobacteria bacterium]